MNERIEKMAESCWDYHLIAGETFFDYKKFAQMIVEECIEQCADYDSNDEWDKGVRWAANQIKERFGIEE